MPSGERRLLLLLLPVSWLEYSLFHLSSALDRLAIRLVADVQNHDEPIMYLTAQKVFGKVHALDGYSENFWIARKEI